ncbi:MarR family transcriptional regulator [candidate division KSB1 bacterium]|nr:MarR family transcriptional regulator [candidate division KSB1 bacterium]
MNKKTIESFRQDIRQIEREIDRQLKDSRICCGVSLAQCHLMMELGSAGRMTISKLAEIMKLDKSTLSRTVEGLVQSGFVERTISSDDRRFMDVEFTKKGAEIFKSINVSCNSIYDRIFERIPVDRHESVIEGISLFAEAMQTIRESSPNGLACKTINVKV